MSSPASIRFESDAREWDAQGRPADFTKPGYYMMQLICWTGSRGAKAVGVSDLLKEYLATLRAWRDRKNPSWYEDLWDDRVYCNYCGESWRLENVAICSNCNAKFPICHTPQTVTLPNGNSECPICCAGEIVG
jgi:hypothetical protein